MPWLVHWARIAFETLSPKTIKNNLHASSLDNSLPTSFTVFTNPLILLSLGADGVDDGLAGWGMGAEAERAAEATVLEASNRFSAAAAMSSLCIRRLSSGDGEEDPAASLGLLRLGSGGECWMLMRSAIWRSSSSWSAIQRNYKWRPEPIRVRIKKLPEDSRCK